MVVNMFLGAASMRRAAALALGLIALVLVGSAKAEIPADDTGHGAERGAVVFAYGRFGEDQYGSGSLALDQFDAHIAELADGGHAVLPLPVLLEKLAHGTPVPDRAVVLTIDDAHRSVYNEAFPRLKAAGVPFTLFVAPDPIDSGAESHMTWAQVREVAKSGATIGVLPAAGLSMPQRTVQQNAADLVRAVERVEAELGVKPTLLAYPFGSYSSGIRDLAQRQGFAAAFTQSSGIVHGRSDRLALPRFVMNEAFGGIDRFRLAANALPLPVADVTPADPVLTQAISTGWPASYRVRAELAWNGWTATASSCASRRSSPPAVPASTAPFPPSRAAGAGSACSFSYRSHRYGTRPA
jgi:poly-beta-1,6-N-acetyl-D-glucosamine N-deacetylase